MPQQRKPKKLASERTPEEQAKFDRQSAGARKGLITWQQKWDARIAYIRGMREELNRELEELNTQDSTERV